MEIDYDCFYDWASKRFNDVKIAGDEIMIPSIFIEDRGYHLSCNPSKNAYHCWKSSKGGNLINLVSIVDKISYSEAAEFLNVNDIRYLESKLQAFLNKDNKPKEITFRKNISLPSNSIKIDNMPENYLKTKIKSYLNKRKIPTQDLYFCTSGKYFNRIIIPYISPENDFFYWNGRMLEGNGPKYRGPDKKEFGIGKGDVLFTKKWAEKGSKVYLTEGEFDAISLYLCGLNSFACGGKEVTDNQIKYLKNYEVCLAFDRDVAGTNAIEKIGNKLENYGFKNLKFIRPPLNFKDWNEVIEKDSFENLKKYIISYEQILNKITLIRLKLSN